MAQHVNMFECDATESALNAALDEHHVNVDKIVSVILVPSVTPGPQPEPQAVGAKYRVLYKN